MTTQQLLALHYAHPLCIQSLQRLLQQIETLDELPEVASSILAGCLHVSEQRARVIQATYKKMSQIDLIAYYIGQDIFPILYMDETYPKQLRNIFNAPAVLYAKGRIELLNAPNSISCIGSRDATNYSAEVIKCILPPLIEQDYVVVSGLAKGADTLAHKAAIYYGGTTIAVLGHGFQTIYPSSNAKLAQIIAKKHLLLTEYAPHFPPKKEHFPQRNRIICGLTQGLIVTEAAMRSGTMITTDLALEQGKAIFAAPGPITSRLSAGTNKLISEGAIPVWKGQQIIEELQMFQIKN